MTLAYAPGDSLAHRLDPRAKLLVQAGFAAAVYATTSPRGLLLATPLAAGCLWAAGGGLGDVRAFRFALPVLLGAPVVAGVTLGEPWIRPARAATTALASYRVGLILVVTAAYVRSTAVRESRAAVHHTVPGRLGAMAGLGVALVFRALPLLRADLHRAHEAVHARGGGARPVYVRMRAVAVVGVRRTLTRADRLGTAMTARCLSWNPTLPALSFGRLDAVALTLGFGLVAIAVASGW